MKKTKDFFKYLAISTYFAFYLIELNKIQENVMMATIITINYYLWLFGVAVGGTVLLSSLHLMKKEIDMIVLERQSLIEKIDKLTNTINGV